MYRTYRLLQFDILTTKSPALGLLPRLQMPTIEELAYQ
jgi:hypothetical protein